MSTWPLNKAGRLYYKASRTAQVTNWYKSDKENSVLEVSLKYSLKLRGFGTSGEISVFIIYLQAAFVAETQD